jgi:opacity protein-like surface antigen
MISVAQAGELELVLAEDDTQSSKKKKKKKKKKVIKKSSKKSESNESSDGETKGSSSKKLTKKKQKLQKDSTGPRQKSKRSRSTTEGGKLSPGLKTEKRNKPTSVEKKQKRSKKEKLQDRIRVAPGRGIKTRGEGQEANSSLYCEPDKPNCSPGSGPKIGPKRRGEMAGRRPQKVSSPLVPDGWNPSYHRAGARQYTKVDPRYWGAGVFFYSPPVKKKRVQEPARVRPQSKKYQAPSKTIDRGGMWRLGARTGNYMSAYQNGGAYSDFGLGASLGYRLFEPLGLEISYGQYVQNLEDPASSDRIASSLQAGAQLFLFPWTRVSPYLTGGIARTSVDINDRYSASGETVQLQHQESLSGPMGGVGIELSPSQHFSIQVEGRYIQYQNIAENSPILPSVLQGTAGLNIYF